MNALTNEQIQQLFLDYSRTWDVLTGCKRTLRLVQNSSDIDRILASQRLSAESLAPLEDAISSLNEVLTALSDANEQILSQLKCDIDPDIQADLIAENIKFTDVCHHVLVQLQHQNEPDYDYRNGHS
ncbi:hypothetical protein [Nostoc sp. MG11]|uniref:hypothetical protein n=1 Tax=Nostoc sp. MG11 TaxID=2721166 RepID=UPI00186734F7|nr:hypothetical protein [Nostoc sp. MG11]